MEITGSELHQDVKHSQENNHCFQFARENKLVTIKRAAVLTGGGNRSSWRRTPELCAYLLTFTAQDRCASGKKESLIASCEQQRPSDNKTILCRHMLNYPKKRFLNQRQMK